jgi:hypothetical protein
MKVLLASIASIASLASFQIAHGLSLGADISTTFGYDEQKQASLANMGLNLNIGLFRGLNWNAWTGLGVSADDSQWATTVQELSFTMNNFTTSLQGKFSSDPKDLFSSEVPFDKVYSLKLKLKLK